MENFVIGVISSLSATLIVFLLAKFAWPILRDKLFYTGIRINGSWVIYENRNGEEIQSGKIKLDQKGRKISGESTRSITRDGKQSNREFIYKGSISGNQLTLLFEDKKGLGFDNGTYVFIIQNDGNTMKGMATFHGKMENQIVSESRILKKIPD